MIKKLIELQKWLRPHTDRAQVLAENFVRKVRVSIKSRKWKITKATIEQDKDNAARRLLRFNLGDFNREDNTIYSEDGYRLRGFAYAGFKNRNLIKPETL